MGYMDKIGVTTPTDPITFDANFQQDIQADLFLSNLENTCHPGTLYFKYHKVLEALWLILLNDRWPDP